MKPEEIKEILRLHLLYLQGGKDGKRAEIRKYMGGRYYVTSKGEIYSAVCRGYLRKEPKKIGAETVKRYVVCILTDWEGKRHNKYLHRVVFEAFNGEVPNRDVHHIDENKRNNSLDNLEAVERSSHSSMHALKQSSEFKDRNIELKEVLDYEYKDIEL